MESQREWNDLFQQLLVTLVFEAEDTTSSDSNEVPSLSEHLDTVGTHVPGLLQRSGQQLVKALTGTGIRNARSRVSNEASHLCALATSLGYYLSVALREDQLDHLAQQLDSTVGGWLRTFLGLPNTFRPVFSLNTEDARALALQAALHAVFPAYGTKGPHALIRTPVCYVSEAFPFDGEELGEACKRLSGRLGLPLDSIIRIPRSKGCYGIDITSLEAAVAFDIAEGRFPVMVLATAGTPLTGHSDDLAALRECCNRHHLWLHVEGTSLALLAIPSAPPIFEEALKADSIAIHPSHIFGAAGPAACTFFRNPFPDRFWLPRSSLASLPLWMWMQKEGLNVLRAAVQRALLLTQLLAKKIFHMHSLHPIDLSADAPHVVIFRYAPVDEDALDKDTINLLNTQLLTKLKTVAQPLDIHTVTIDGQVCFHFAPTFSPSILATTEETVIRFAEALTHDVTLIDSTLNCRDAFEEAVSQHTHLVMVPVQPSLHFVGLGAIKYIPEYLLPQRTTKLAKDAKKDIDTLNVALAERLRKTDSIFSPGTADDGGACLLVGVASPPVNDERMQQIVNLIDETTGNLEISQKVLENMGEVIRRSIHDAEEQIEEENLTQFAEEGIIRHLPVVGPVFNWLLPHTPSPVKGRTFDIRSRQLESTEATYDMRTQSSLSRSNSHDSSSGIPAISRRLSSGSKSSSKTFPVEVPSSKPPQEESHPTGHDTYYPHEQARPKTHLSADEIEEIQEEIQEEKEEQEEQEEQEREEQEQQEREEEEEEEDMR
eukprot:TRINITY_DN11440_c0_g1_i1.p1 TRINITY_DN11440_c0_g1~~TRINITY_DN11440_c0_g1_i1.p1  ORF type:complete len:828 (+),score=182.51 TRINITY_DN11440_c0_g1_i1:171-2486(+)